MRSACLAPEILKPRRRQLRVPDRMLNVAVTKVSLDRSGIMSLVGQGITAGMPIPSVLRVHAESDIRYTHLRGINRALNLLSVIEIERVRRIPLGSLAVDC